jgi:hypothetical protein
MFCNSLNKYTRIIYFFICILFSCFYANAEQTVLQELSPEKINLALRRTADGLLLQTGDSTSRIPAIEQIKPNVWRLQLNQPFRYEQLPFQLQSSLDLYEIKHRYEVAIRKCEDATIDLGFHQSDYLNTGRVPCAGRELPETCHYIEITFLEEGMQKSVWSAKSGILLLLLVGIIGFWFYRKQKLKTSLVDVENELVDFGNSRLDVSGQFLIHGNARQSLTFRETKLLKLFATNPDQLLERDYILKQVWADEGVLVGRSIDMFVSRLRKKLAVDSSLNIAAVHGVGYRLETGK